MLGLPASTEIHRLISKKKVYEHFGAEMSAERRKRFDADIARMTLTNEISPASVNLSVGERVHSFFVLHILLKARDYDPQSIAYLPKLFGQRLLMVLECEGRQRLAIWQSRLLTSEWREAGTLTVPLVGLNLDRAWEEIVREIAGLESASGATLDEQIARAAECEKLQKRIAKLEKQAWAEKQPKRKFELAEEIKAQQAILEEMKHG